MNLGYICICCVLENDVVDCENCERRKEYEGSREN